MVVVALAHVACNPSVFAASLRPNSDTPSVVAKQSFRQRIQRVFSAEIFANHLQAGYSALHGVMLMLDCYFSHFKEHRRITFCSSGFDLLLYPYTCFEKN